MFMRYVHELLLCIIRLQYLRGRTGSGLVLGLQAIEVGLAQGVQVGPPSFLYLYIIDGAGSGKATYIEV